MQRIEYLEWVVNTGRLACLVASVNAHYAGDGKISEALRILLIWQNCYSSKRIIKTDKIFHDNGITLPDL